MVARALCAVMLLLSLAVSTGCEQRKGAGKPAWPITREQLRKVARMPRAEREAWFSELGVPDYQARRADGPIQIDGRLDEPQWARAGLIMFREHKLGGKVRYGTRVRMLWDDEAIYLAFECDDPDIHNPLTRHDEDLWQHDIVEVFIDADGDSMSYMEFHVAPSGATVDAVWADLRPQTDWFTMSHPDRFDLPTGYRIYEPAGVTSAVRLNGTLNHPGDVDRGWTVEWRIPCTAMVNVVSGEQKPTGPIDFSLLKLVPIEKPRAGTVWRMNFARSDDSIHVREKNAAGELVEVGEYSAWAPTAGSFHMPFLFGRVQFVE